MRKILIGLAALLVTGVAAVFAAGHILSSPAQTAIAVPGSLPGAVDVSLPVAHAPATRGWFIQGKDGKGAVLLLHGLRGNRLDMVDRARLFASRGYSVLLIDLPGHGESKAEHITFGRNESKGVDAALRYLHDKLPGERIGVIGTSLGAASFVFSAQDVPVAAVVLESMYPAIDEAVSDRLRLRLGSVGPYLAPLLLWQLPLQVGLQPQRLRPIDELAKIHAPILIAAGTRDQHTTQTETRTIYSRANGPKMLWMVDGAAHVDLYSFDRTKYEQVVGTFLANNLRSGA